MLVTLDFETYYAKDYSLSRLTTLDYVTDPRFEVIMCGIKLGDRPTEIYSGPALTDELIRLFGPGNENTLLCHNTMFDGLILDRVYGLQPYRYADTQSMFRGLATYLSSSLDSMCQSLFPDDPTIRKTHELSSFMGFKAADFSEADWQTFSDYCVNDVNVTHACYLRMMEFFPRDELDIIDITLKMWCQPKFRLDEGRVTAFMQMLNDKQAVLLAEAKTYFGITKTTLSSNQKFAKWLENWGVQPPMKTNAKGQPALAFAKDDLEYTAIQAKHPGLKTVWDARTSVKSTIEASRAERLLNNAAKDEGFLRIPLKYYGAATGRYSGMEKINVQNLKRGSELRLALTAPVGQLVYVADSSQIEARVNAWLSGQDDLLQDFAQNADVYSKFASVIYGRPVDRKLKVKNADGTVTTPDFLEGFVGKICVLGLGYGMGWRKFQETLAKGAMGGPPVWFPDEDAKRIVTLYRSKNSRIKANWGYGDAMLRAMMNPDCDYEWGPTRVLHKRILLPNGMFLNYHGLTAHATGEDDVSFEYWNGQFMTHTYGAKLVENLVQALARIVVMEQTLTILREMPELQLALQVHDEGVFVGPELDPEPRMERILAIMSAPPKWAAGLPVSAEGGYDRIYSK